MTHSSTMQRWVGHADLDAFYASIEQRDRPECRGRPVVVEPVSVDEAYLDLSGLEKLLGSPEAIGHEIKQRILAGTRLTASVGIGPNRLIAKLGSEHRKPDGLTVVTPDEILDFLAPMPVASLRGVGQQTQKVFSRLGVRTVAQLRAIPLYYLEKQLGRKAATSFHNQAFGIASAEVVPGRGRKSISKETTFEEDIREQGILHAVLRELAAEVAATTRRENLSGSVITLKIRFTGFETHTRQHKLPVPTHDERVILREAWALFLHGKLPRKPVRLIGVGISDWQQAEPVQADLFDQPQERETDNRLLETLDRIADRFGKGMLQIGGTRKADKRKPR